MRQDTSPRDRDGKNLMDGTTLSAERTIPAEPSVIFALLADAANHPVLDGSGTVQRAHSGGGEPLLLGSRFGMSMRLGLPYSTVNTVVEYERDRLIAWQTTVSGPLGTLAGGRIWRYELTPSGDATRVRETWDISREPARAVMKRTSFPARTEENMKRTLERIEQQVSGTV